MKTQLRKQNRQRGFTIIEVMIVLAIAGLILAIVFLAVPSLQRNARNNSRRNDVSHLIGLVNEYEANNNGQLPTNICLTAASCASNPTWLNITSENWAIMNTPATAGGDIVIAPTAANYGSLNTMKINEGYLCTSGALTTTNASSHSFAVGMQVETSGAAQNVCVSG